MLETRLFCFWHILILGLRSSSSSFSSVCQINRFGGEEGKKGILLGGLLSAFYSHPPFFPSLSLVSVAVYPFHFRTQHTNAARALLMLLLAEKGIFLSLSSSSSSSSSSSCWLSESEEGGGAVGAVAAADVVVVVRVPVTHFSLAPSRRGRGGGSGRHGTDGGVQGQAADDDRSIQGLRGNNIRGGSRVHGTTFRDTVSLWPNVQENSVRSARSAGRSLTHAVKVFHFFVYSGILDLHKNAETILDFTIYWEIFLPQDFLTVFSPLSWPRTTSWLEMGYCIKVNNGPASAASAWSLHTHCRCACCCCCQQHTQTRSTGGFTFKPATAKAGYRRGRIR